MEINSYNITGTTFTFMARPNYCSNCGAKIEAAWNFCGGCGIKIAAPPQVSPTTTITYPMTSVVGTQRCAFDGLPPGTYGLYCGCPKHATFCS